MKRAYTVKKISGMGKNTLRWSVRDADDVQIGEPYLTRDQAKNAAKGLNATVSPAE